MVSRWALRRAAIKLFRGNIALKRGERVALVTDRERCPIFSVLLQACKELGGIPVEVHLTPDREHSSPIPEVKEALNESSVIVAATDKSISHSPETMTARKKHGARVASMPGITPALFLKAMETDVAALKKVNSALARKLAGAKCVILRTPAGTKLAFDVRGVEFNAKDNGDISKRGVLNNVPFGEVYAAPLPLGSGSGKLAIDFSRAGIKPSSKAVVEIRRGKIVEWTKGAAGLVERLRGVGECALHAVELGFGTNPMHKKIIGNILHDEKIAGSAHIAFGGWGDLNRCPVHEDVVLLKPTVIVDGRKIMQDGKLV